MEICKFGYLFLPLLLVISGCDEEHNNYDFKMISITKSNIGIKNQGLKDIQGCDILINGSKGFRHEPGKSAFAAGESRMFSLTRFYSTGHRQFDRRVDQIGAISVSCSRPKISVQVFDSSGNLTNF
ncbi:hypothetical protein [Kiloniella antarctica]|uniref:Lipoprotein n=1 Tax=Kiloniella antarctica TaxID=1550907 RepID=A0ABW5BI36_9PROT